MAWMQCRSCSAKFAVGLLRCPQCSAMSELYAAPEEVIEAEKETAMPKITIAGVSNALEAREPGAATAAPAVEDAQPAPDPVADAVPEGAVADAAEDDTEAAVPEPAAAPATKKRAAKKTAATPQA